MNNIRYDDVINLKVGDVFYECQSGFNIEARVTVAPKYSDNNPDFIKWQAVNTQDGTVIEYSLTKGLSMYGPKIYTKPQYISKNSSGESVFELMGAK